MESAVQQFNFKPDVSIFPCLYSPKQDASSLGREEARKAMVSPLAKLFLHGLCCARLLEGHRVKLRTEQHSHS